jgi:glycerone phosphate O-acyltransferase/fatty acyl-CoA reductase
MIIVNEDTLSKIKAMCANRKGPIIFCPTHRSYVDFMILSVVLFFYNMEVPHICAGEDFLGIAGVVHLLRASGAFFMRRTFRGDPLYKAVFHEYVTQLCTDKMCLEFFVEGTRSRTNKMLPAKFGFLSIINNCYFDRKIEEATFVPVTLNYTKVFEDESFPNELRGEQKVKESLGRIIKAVEVFKMNFGTIYLDFFEPINLSEVVAQQKQINSAFDPFTNKADRTKVNQVLGN